MSTRTSVSCPACGVKSSRVHSHYQRTPHDLPVQGRRVRLFLTVRKFFCANRHCGKKIFCERLEGLLNVYARRTLRLTAALQHLALLVNANTARLLGKGLGLAGSARSLLRLAHAYQPRPVKPREISVDDFAFRRGRNYGSIVLDFNTGRPIEVLPVHNTETLKGYFATQPQLTLISRDRDKRIAEAIAWGAPQTQVVLDLWHLLRNFADAFEKCIIKRHRAFRENLHQHYQQLHQAQAREAAAAEEIMAVPAEPAKASSDKQRHRLERFERVQRLYLKGWNKTAIARETNLSRETVTTYLKREHAPDYARRKPRKTKLDQFKPYLQRRWAEGCHNSARLNGELQQQGYTGSLRAVTRYLRRWRAHPPPDAPVKRLSSWQLPAPRALSWSLLQDDPETPNATTNIIETLLKVDEDAARLTRLARDIYQALRTRNVPAWHEAARQALISPYPELRAFIHNLCKEGTALDNTFTLANYSNGPTEGHINRIKLIKRSMYGRASFHLLRNKILYHPH